jgi:hypothetical protein
MAFSIENLNDLKEKIIRVEGELAEIRLGLEQLADSLNQDTEIDWLDKTDRVDLENWKEWFDKWFQQIGITGEPISAEELQEMGRQEGIKPEDNLLSSGIVSMMEE